MILPNLIDPPALTPGHPAGPADHLSTNLAPSSLTPQEQLNRGIIHTDISRPLAVAITIGFLAIIAAIPLMQAAVEYRRQKHIQAMEVLQHFPSTTNLHGFEKDLEKESIPRTSVQPGVQWAITRIGGFGNSKGVVGDDGWLFYQPGVDYLIGPGVLDEGNMSVKRKDVTGSGKVISHPDPRLAILQFAAQCRAAGARLVLMPIPDKAMLQPAQLTCRMKFDAPIAPPNNPDFERLLAELRAAGVDVFYPAPAVIAPGEIRFLAQDTHWTPQWMEQVAGALAQHVETAVTLSPRMTKPLVGKDQHVSRIGDLVDMLKLPADQTNYPPQTVTVRRIEAGKGEPWQPRRDAEVLLLGDSFSNIYSVEAMGWGESAGLAEQLSFSLQRPVDRISRNDAGAYATRQMLAGELARGRNRLAGKKGVVWEFAIRELQVGDWKPIEMKLGTPAPSRFVVPKHGEHVRVTGTIESIALPPRPGTVPYKDHIIAMHLIDLQSSDPKIAGGEALVYVWSMRNNEWTATARYREGQPITLQLSPWSDVSGKLDAINRRDLDDETLNLEEPCWGEETK